MPAAKKTTEKKASASKAAASKAAAPKSKATSAFFKPVQPDEVLAKIIGNKAMPRTEIVKKLWAYIRKHDLQDKAKKTMINADEAMKAFFDGAEQLSMFAMNKQVSAHIVKEKN